MMRAVVCIVALLLAPAAPVASAEPPPEEPTIALPLTLDKLWYRSGGKKREGDLTVSAEGFEFTTRKRVFSIPLERLHVVSYGKLRGDVDTDWIVLSVGVGAPYDLVAFRDGSKWGYGSRTRELYNQLRRVLEQLAAAQYDAPDGYAPYEDPDRTMSTVIPEGWHSYLESLVLVGGRAARGTTILSEQKVRTVEQTSEGRAESVDDLELLDRILAGESPGFFIERDDAVRGMGCDGFSGGATERILERARRDLAFGEGYEIVAAPAASPATVGDCEGLRVLGRSRRQDGAEVVLELFAAAQGDTLTLVGLRALADRYEQHREPFRVAVDSVRFGVALP
jgi:hypothetical protein